MQPNEPEQTPLPQVPPPVSTAPVQPQQPSVQPQPAPQVQQQAPSQPLEQPQTPVQQPVVAQPQVFEQPQPVQPQEVLAVQVSPPPAEVPQTPVAQPELVQEQPLQTEIVDELGDNESEQDGPIDEDQGPSELPLTEPVTWQATEYIQHDKNPLWYVFFVIIVVILMGIAIWLGAWTFVALIPIMAVALVIYTHRPPREVSYAVSEKGLYINDQLHPMGEFKSFGVLPDSELHALMLVPVKRFRPGTTLYFPDEIGEELVDALGAYLPMQELHVDAVDKIIRKLRI